MAFRLNRLRLSSNIIEAYNNLGISLPKNLRNLRKDAFAALPVFYVLTVDNNPVSVGATTPKQTMAAYLLTPGSPNYLAWVCRRPAIENVQDKYGIDVLDATLGLPVTFIFSRKDISKLMVKDILEDSSYEIIK